MNDISEKWIALVEVRPKLLGSDLEQPAYVNILGLASSESEFIDSIHRECERLDVEVTKVDEIERWHHRLEKFRPNIEVIRLANSLSEEVPIVFDNFYCFEEEGQ